MDSNTPGAPRAAVIGTGRSGTGYMARLITEATGHATCGHEGWWCQLGEQTPGLDVDSSWLALPDIEQRAWTGPVVHVVRHPVKVVKSLLRTEFFGMHASTPYPQYAFANCAVAAAALETAGPIAAAVEFWADWNARCAAVAKLTVRLEDVSDFDGGEDSVGAATLDLVGDVLGVEFGSWQVAAEIPKDVNTRESITGLPMRVDEAYVWGRLAGRGGAYGYGQGA